MSSCLQIGKHQLSSRLILGTGKYPDNDSMAQALDGHEESVALKGEEDTFSEVTLGHDDGMFERSFEGLPVHERFFHAALFAFISRLGVIVRDVV